MLLAKRRRSYNNNYNLIELQLHEQARAFYDKADASGVVIKPDVFKNFKEATINDLATDGIDLDAYPFLNRTFRLLNGTTVPTYRDIDIIKRSLNTARTGPDPDRRRVANIVNGYLNDFIDDLTPDKVLAGDASGWYC